MLGFFCILIYKIIKIKIMSIVKRRFEFLSSVEPLNVNNIILFIGA